MKEYLVILQECIDNIYQPSIKFTCIADDQCHACEQCFDMYPNCHIISVERVK